MNRPLDIDATIAGPVVELRYGSHGEAVQQLRQLRERLAAHDALVAAARPLVAMTRAEALEKDHHGMWFMYCQCDVLNPCWDNRPDDIAGKHWGGGDACPECNLRAAIAKATGSQHG